MGALVVSRKQGQSVVIGNVIVKVKKIKGKRASLVIEAPDCISIKRLELQELDNGANGSSAVGVSEGLARNLGD